MVLWYCILADSKNIKISQRRCVLIAVTSGISVAQYMEVGPSFLVVHSCVFLHFNTFLLAFLQKL